MDDVVWNWLARNWKWVLVGGVVGVVVLVNLMAGEEDEKTTGYTASPPATKVARPETRPTVVSTLPRPSATARVVHPTPTLVPLYAPTHENCEAMQWSMSQMQEAGFTPDEVKRWTLDAFPYDMVMACIEKGY